MCREMLSVVMNKGCTLNTQIESRNIDTHHYNNHYYLLKIKTTIRGIGGE